MKKFVSSGGNSGIRLEAARQLVAQGHHQYVAHRARVEPQLSAVVNVGLVKTEIMRDMPALMGVMFTVTPFMTIPVEKAAANPVWLCTHDGWKSGAYLGKPGKHDDVTPLALDAQTTEKVIATSRELTGA